jgi:hypothetical protein
MLPFMQTLMGPGNTPVPGAGSGGGSIIMQSKLRGIGADNTERTLRTDNYGIIRNRPYEPYATEAADTVTNGYNTIYTVPAGVIARVKFRISNITANEVLVSVNIGGAEWLPGGATPAFPLQPAAPGYTSPWIQMAAAEVVQHRCGTVNGAQMWVRIEEFDTGDEPTGAN